VEEIGRSSVAAEQRASQPSGLVSVASATAVVGVSVGSGLVGAIPEPIPEPIRRQALQHVDAELVKSRLIGAIGGQVSPEAQKQYSFELRSSLPTPGLMVKGCLDECNTCEPALQQQIKLELERKQLENQLLQRQIDLLEKSQEYRCCPNGVEKTA
jgi:hypothetical protein